MPRKPMIDTMQRVKFDDLYTPEEAVPPLLKYFPKQYHRVWECTDVGRSNITAAFDWAGFDVLTSDIATGFDFLSQEPEFEFDAIVTNPPYSLKDQFLAQCYEYGKPFALLLPVTALAGIRRGGMYRKYGLGVIILDRRLDFTGKGANWFDSAWFCHMPELDDQIIFEEVR